jgi:hypothetical protein
MPLADSKPRARRCSRISADPRCLPRILNGIERLQATKPAEGEKVQ